MKKLERKKGLDMRQGSLRGEEFRFKCGRWGGEGKKLQPPVRPHLRKWRKRLALKGKRAGKGVCV